MPVTSFASTEVAPSRSRLPGGETASFPPAGVRLRATHGIAACRGSVPPYPPTAALTADVTDRLALSARGPFSPASIRNHPSSLTQPTPSIRPTNRDADIGVRFGETLAQVGTHANRWDTWQTAIDPTLRGHLSERRVAEIVQSEKGSVETHKEPPQ